MTLTQAARGSGGRETLSGPSPFSSLIGEAGLDNSIKLAVARDLERLYSPLLTEPIPPNLRSYIDRLGQAIVQATQKRAVGAVNRRD